MGGVLAEWGGLQVVGRLGGGNRNEVLEVRLGAQRLVARRSRRSPASLSWEVRLLEHLARCGIRVPVVVPALDGRPHVNGMIVMGWVDATDLDLAELPGADLPRNRLAVVRAAATAWETANGWIVEPSYARRQLTLLQAGTDNFE